MEIDTDFSHLEFVLAWFFIYFPWGRNGVKGAANGIAWVIESAHKGTGFAFASFTTGKQMDMAISAISYLISCTVI